ncbi:sugar kinase [Deminuibacter soli]|uniref:Sugar kinase n=1 Tax=Deminuibacter soli TaxID=2291815 RepID=A0A3E1NKY9_9BACT|nr:sugar kinase [Deminuibacter soli]RFM28600.1 sugar kinase [Deminuibacter soli]
MKKVFCFGELLLRMSPVLNGTWIKENSMPVFIGGAELNVAHALANWQVPVQYCTALPANYLSAEICTAVQAKNIDTSTVLFSGERIGTYYLPQGADLKHAGVIYDRAYSSFWSLKPGTIDWDTLLAGASWFHFSAISPALNENVVAVCKEGLEAATRLGLKISVDLNYRARLWQYGKTPASVMRGLAGYCDVIMGNIWAAATLLDIPVDNELIAADSRENYLEHASRTAAAIMEQFPRCTTVANTFRFDDGHGGIRYYAALNQPGVQFVSHHMKAASIADKVGSGDCFMAGLIYGIHNGHTPQQVINYAAAAAFGKLQETGDATRQTISSIHSILASYE